MNETGNDAVEAARRLGISLSYLYRLLREDHNQDV
jgi:DNA-binding NtrC family response regulator